MAYIIVRNVNKEKADSGIDGLVYKSKLAADYTCRLYRKDKLEDLVVKEINGKPQKKNTKGPSKV